MTTTETTTASRALVIRRYDRETDWWDVYVEQVEDGALVTRRAGGSSSRDRAQAIADRAVAS